MGEKKEWYYYEEWKYIDQGTESCAVDTGSCIVEGRYLGGDSEHLPPEKGRLIAAAPDLLAACERIAEYGDIFAYKPDDSNPYEQLIKAIAKAKGENQ